MAAVHERELDGVWIDLEVGSMPASSRAVEQEVLVKAVGRDILAMAESL